MVLLMNRGAQEDPETGVSMRGSSRGFYILGNARVKTSLHK